MIFEYTNVANILEDGLKVPHYDIPSYIINSNSIQFTKSLLTVTKDTNITIIEIESSSISKP